MEILGKIDQDPNVSKSNQLHVDLLWTFVSDLKKLNRWFLKLIRAIYNQ